MEAFINKCLEILQVLESAYFQFVNFVQTMPTIWFVTICLLLAAGALVCVMKFFKAYNGTQKKFEKGKFIVLALILFALLVYWTSIR